MRLLYSFAWYLALPLVLFRLWRRGAKEPGYRAHWRERLGCCRHLNKPHQPLIWVHAVSVGETRAAEPLIRALLERYPQHAILLTHMTPTGRATGHALFGGEPRLLQSYLPYDTGWLAGRFLRHFAPRICVLMETEVWPNLIAQCRKRRIPVTMANGRLSERSLKKAQRFSALFTQAARGIACIGAQTEADAARFRQLGAPDVRVTGSLKFDVAPPAPMRERGRQLHERIGARPVLSCAITREGEEATILDAFAQADLGDTLLLLVPRHPQRFDDVARLIEQRGLSMRRRSLLGDGPLARDVRVLLGDTMGEMFAYHAASDIVFIGGSLQPLGGHNLIEACALGKPVLIGPHTFNFQTITEQAIAAGAAQRISSAADLMEAARQLLRDDALRDRIGQQALSFAAQHRGATARTLSLLQPLLS